MRSRYEPCPKCRAKGNDNAGDNLVYWPDGSAHCFSCGYHIHPKHYIPKVVENNVPKSLCPVDFTREVPTEYLKWLLQFGLPWSYWKESIGYSPSEERLIFRVEYNGTLAFSIGRYTGVADPAPRKWYTWGDPHKHCHVVRPTGEGQSNSIVLVEDLISAHKVGQVATCIPLFGTRWHPCHLYYLINEAKPVILWLDKDQANTVKGKALQLEQLLNQPVTVVSTDKDPKWLTEKEIYEKVYC